MKTGKAVLLLILLATSASVLIVPTSRAIARMPPSGVYLQTSNGHEVQYDNSTSTVTDLGLPSSIYEADSYHCQQSWTGPAQPASSQCGECSYVPPGTNTAGDLWYASASQYILGRCVSAQAVAVTDTLTARVDVRVFDDSGAGPFSYVVAAGSSGSGGGGLPDVGPWDVSATHIVQSGDATNGNCISDASVHGFGTGVIWYCSTRDSNGVPGVLTITNVAHNYNGGGAGWFAVAAVRGCGCPFYGAPTSVFPYYGETTPERYAWVQER